MSKRWKYEDVKAYVENEGYKFLSIEYKNMNNQTLESLCPNGHQYNFKFKNFISGTRCVDCRRTTKDEFIKKACDNGYKVVGDFKNWNNSRDSVLVECEFGHIAPKRYDSLHKGCQVCQYNGMRIDYLSVKKFIENENYILLDSEYKNCTIPLNLICTKGHNIKIGFDNFKHGNRCIECRNDGYRKDYEEVVAIVESRGYKLLSESYKNSREDLHLQCSKGHDFHITLYGFNSREGECSICNPSTFSKGEAKISSILDKFNIKYCKQFRFADCKDKKRLPFDFYITSLNLVIEYDGLQHFQPVDMFDGEKGYAETIYHDNIKNQYCEDNNIKIVRIPYWEFKNIEEILTQHIILE